MSRNGAGLFTLDPRYLVSEGDTILPSQHNPVLEDLQTDANTPRPIVAGGTGASTATTARTNLSVYSIADVDDGFTPKVATRTALKALDTATTKAVVLTEASRQKLFMWMTGDFTDSVAGDTSELAYIPADGIDPALGCWVAVTGAGASIVPVIQGGTGANDAATALDNLGGMAKATYDPNGVSSDAFDMANMVEATDAKIMTAAERADLAKATLNDDADVSANSWVIDEDDMASDSATKVPTQQSVKAYADTKGALSGGNTWTGVQDFQGNQIKITGVAPAHDFIQTDGPDFRWQLNGNSLTLLADPDDNGSFDTTALSINGTTLIGQLFGSDIVTAANGVSKLNVKALNDDGGFTFDTTATTQDFMPANGIGGTFKAAHVFASSDDAEFDGMRSGQALVRTVTGAGGLNPIGDYTQFIVAQNPDYTDTTLGELGALRLATLANGRGDKDLIVGTVDKHKGDGTSDEGASMAFELGVRQFQNNSLIDLTHHHQIIGAFMPNPISTWGQKPIGYYSEHYLGAGFSHFLGIDDEPGTGIATMLYGIFLARNRDVDTPYFTVSGGGKNLESIWQDTTSAGGEWRRTKDSATPIANDLIWNDYWRGRNSAGEYVDYARLYGSIVDTTDGSEDGQLVFRTLFSGTEIDQLKIQNGLAVGSPTSGATGVGSVNLASALYVNGTQVVKARQTGWEATTGSSTKVAFDTSTVTLQGLAQRVKSVLDDLTTHGLIGA